MAILSGTVREVGEGFIVLDGGSRVKVSSRVRPDGLAAGAVVSVKALLREGEWIAEDVEVR